MRYAGILISTWHCSRRADEPNDAERNVAAKGGQNASYHGRSSFRG